MHLEWNSYCDAHPGVILSMPFFGLMGWDTSLFFGMRHSNYFHPDVLGCASIAESYQALLEVI